MEAKQQLKSLTPYQPGKNIEDVKKELGLNTIVKLASNENPMGCSLLAKKAIERELSQSSVYPDGYAAVLRKKTAQMLKVSPRNLIFGAGSDEIIQIICRTYLTARNNTIMAHPTFSQYKHNAIVEGAEVREIPLKKDGRHDLERMLDTVDEQTAIIWLCMVNNPSGEYIREPELKDFLQNVSENVLVVCDEAYKEYVVAEDYPNTIGMLKEYPNLVITRTFSKIYGLAALRMGYGIAGEQVMHSLESVRQPFNTSRMGQAAAAAALDDQDFIQQSSLNNREGLKMFYHLCASFDLSYYPSQGNFILIDFHQSGDTVFDHLLKKGYIVRSGTVLGFPNAVRITVGTHEQTEGLIDYLSNWLQHRHRS